jgi:dihydroxyacetone kinase-like protein
MQRIINDPDNLVDEMLSGFKLAHPELITGTPNKRVLKYKEAPVKGRVGIVTGGGSGHKPAFIGYLGKNMIDAVAVGEIFSSPTAVAFYDAFKSADGGKGVACLYGNYSGDNMNVRMAQKMAEKEGITVRTVVANDDVPSASKNEREKRRGVAGEVLMWKVGAASAARGASLDEVISVSRRAIENTRSIGIGLTPCTIPAVGKPNFFIEQGKMEIGIGHHGEPGIEISDLKTADDIAGLSCNILIPDLPFESGCEVVVLVSGLGATPVMEQYVFYRRVSEILKDRNIRIHKSFVGNYFTSLDMMGITLTMLKLDDELKELIDYPADAVSFKQV